MPIPAELVAKSVNAKQAPRFAALLESERLARAAAREAAQASALAEHEAEIRFKIGESMKLLQRAREALSRDATQASRVREIERDTRGALAELHKFDVAKRDAHNWPEPTWSVDETIGETPRPAGASPAAFGSAPVEPTPAPGWANA